MKIAVVDDERPARSELIFLLKSVLDNAEYYEADSAATAVTLLAEHEFSAIFLDINLGDVKGTTLASIIREKQPKAGIVFVTAYQDYAVEAFELDAVDYLLKPFDLKRLEKAIEKLTNQGYLKQETETEEKAIPFTATDKIAINGGNSIILVDLKDIVVVESNQRGCRIHTRQKVYEDNITLNHMMEKLKGHPFCRVHKSYVVNLNYVEELVPSYNNGYSMRMKYCSSELIPISRSQVKTIRNMFT